MCRTIFQRAYQSLCIFIVCGMILSCSHKTSVSEPIAKNVWEAKIEPLSVAAGPAVIIYKTKDNYYDKVPVTLNDDKSRIVAYPDIQDVVLSQGNPYPTRLINGFLLDNRGINGNSAFLNYTYKEYSQLSKTPSAEVLFAKILDADPFLEMYKCGNQHEYQSLRDELNEKIKNNKLETFEKIK